MVIRLIGYIFLSHFVSFILILCNCLNFSIRSFELQLEFKLRHPTQPPQQPIIFSKVEENDKEKGIQDLHLVLTDGDRLSSIRDLDFGMRIRRCFFDLFSS